jgi:hypothetical protein
MKGEMDMSSRITHKLALALRLSDATGGMGIEKDTLFFVDGEQRRPFPKPNGYFAFTKETIPEEDFDLEVRASGYVPTKKRVLLEAPGIGPPLLRIEMIPEDNPLSGNSFQTLSGTRKGLVAIDAVKLGESPCFAKEFDARTKVLAVRNPYRLEFDRAGYALVNPKELCYETFTVAARVSDEAFKIDHPLISNVSADFPVAPVISGSVSAGGEYLLRLRDAAVERRWIVRFKEDAREYFNLVDFNEPETVSLVAAPPATGAKE